MSRLIQFILNLVYNFKIITRIVLVLLVILLTVGFETQAQAQEEIPIDYDPPIKYRTWSDFQISIKEKVKVEKLNGESEVITGFLALAAGLVGDSMAKDPLERGVYTLFQSIGIASIGLGMYDQSVGDDYRVLYHLLSKKNSSLTEAQRDSLVTEYNQIHSYYEAREKRIKKYTFGLMALTQLYNGARVKNESVKNTMYFIGAVNALVAVSYSF